MGGARRAKPPGETEGAWPLRTPRMYKCSYTVGLINIGTKTPVPLGEGLPIVLSKEWWSPV